MSMNGIDISHHQKGLDLGSINFDFVIMKATEGIRFVDDQCNAFYQKAKSMGKCLGVYHYANGGNYKAEADHFLSKVSDYVGEAMLVLDWEGQGNSQWDKTDREWVKNWCDYVFEKTGVKPVIYIQKSAMNRVSDLGYDLWVAQYANNNRTGYQETPWNEGAYSCLMRQYSSAGRLNGYLGNLDIDKFYGDKNDWASKVCKSGLKSDPSLPTIDVVKEPVGSVLELAVDVMKNKYGSGDDRKKALGSRYQEVQNFINYIDAADVNNLVEETKAGKYGNGDTRKIILGKRYDEVQQKINGSQKSVYHTVQKGETLSGIAGKYGTTYQEIAKLNGIANPNKIYPGQKLRVK